MNNAIADDPLTNAIFPLPKPRPTFLPGNILFYMLGMMFSGVWTVQVTCPSYALSQFLLLTSSLPEHITSMKSP